MRNRTSTVFLLDRDLRILVAQGDSTLRLPWLSKDLFWERHVGDLDDDVPAEILELPSSATAAWRRGHWRSRSPKACCSKTRSRRWRSSRPCTSTGSGWSSTTSERGTRRAPEAVPLDGLKIDRSSLEDFETDPRTVAIVEAVVTMSRALAVNVITEGIEADAQLERLREMGRHRAQGFLFCRPLVADAMAEWLTSRL